MPVECLECGGLTTDDETPISCAKCNSFFHPHCVELAENGKVKSCRKCVASEARKQLNVPTDPTSNRRRSVSSRSSKSSSSRSSQSVKKDLELLQSQRKLEQLALDQLQAERDKYFEEKQTFIKNKLAADLKYLQEKTVLEKELGRCDDAFDDCESVTSSHMARERVASWKTQQQQQQIPIPKQVSVDVPIAQQTFNLGEINNLSQIKADTTIKPQQVSSTFHKDVQPQPTTAYQRTARPSKEALINRNSDMKNLPTFSGLAKEWPVFIRQFEESTEKCEFTDSDNLVRLRSSLKGNALRVVSNALSYPDNVSHIITTLRQLFGRPEFILNELVQDVRQMSPIKLDKFEDLIHFAIMVSSMCSTMKSAKMSDHLWNPLLQQELVNKLPTQLRREWAQYVSLLQIANIETFSFWMNARAQEYSFLLTAPPTFQESKKKHFVNVHENVSCLICGGSCSNVGQCKQFEQMEYKDKWIFVKDQHLCRLCLKKHRGRCFEMKECGLNGCAYKHHPKLHKSSSDYADSPPPTTGSEIVNTHSSNHQGIMFKILPITLHYEGKSVDTYALLDDGSSVTLVEQWIADALNVKGVPDELCLKWTGDTHKVEKDSKRISIQISGTTGRQQFILSNARTVSNLNLPQQSIFVKELSEQFEHLRNIPVQSFHNKQPSVLIGLDNAKLTTSLKLKEGDSHEPVASKTRLGWVIFGGKGQLHDVQSYHTCQCQRDLLVEMDATMKHFIALDNLLVDKPQSSLLSLEDERALRIMKSTVKFLGDRYEIGLLWKFDHFSVPYSYSMAYRRLICLEKTLNRDPALKKNIAGQIEEYLQKGYAEKVNHEDIGTTDQSWYLPIFTVRNPKKPAKVRIVWDAASEVDNISLNTLLLKGPDQLTNLPGVLFRFRQFRIAVAGDIKQMFHQIVIRKDDRKFQRFLWRKSPELDVEVFQMNVMTFGASCSPSCSQFVKNINADRFSEEMPEAVQAIKCNHYVDDWLQSVENDRDAVKLINQVRLIHQKGGFEICHFLSNSPLVLENLPSVNSNHTKTFQEEGDNTEKLLGMWWDMKSDNFVYSLKYHKVNEKVLQGEQTPTKREVLKLLMSIFDPLGLISHFLIYPKIFMQEIWKSGIDWDQLIPDTLSIKWTKWIKELPKIEDIRIPRWYGLTSNAEAELHVFVDSSRDAFAAAAYLRICGGDEVRCNLISAKTKVAPLKLLSIPRLELSAAILGCRLAQNLVSNHTTSFKRIVFWTDSKTVWCWLNSDHRAYKQYVAFRVAEILETTERNQWRWLPSNLNIADKATRQTIPSESDNSQWFFGPAFLYSLDERAWPTNLKHSEETQEELRSHILHQSIIPASPVDFSRFSKFRRLTRCMAYVRRFIFNSKASKNNVAAIGGPLTKSELLFGESYCFKIVQGEVYPDEIAELTNNNKVNRKSPLFKMSPYLDKDGLIRSKSRLASMVNAHEDFVNPIILPKEHHVVMLLICFYHDEFGHQYQNTVIHEINQRFIIPSLRTTLKKVRNSCQHCKNLNAAPLVPIMGNLPRARLTPFTQPFTFIGIDYFGPYFIAVGRKRLKRWGVLITCLNTRAVHLDVCETLTTDSCICALKRFMARRGEPREIYSDQGTNFKGTSNELKDAILKLSQNDFATEFNSSHCQWYFNPPLAPHMGGVWERLVRSVKMALDHSMSVSSRTPREELLTTMLCEAEFIINSRPLTYIPLDSEVSDVLTPNHFILGSSNGIKTFGIASNDPSFLKENWKRSNRLVNCFWKRWIREYLPVIRRRSKWFEEVRELEVGDVVIMVEDNCDKNLWRKAKVIEVTKSRDGHVRKAIVQTAAKNIYERAASKLAILDVKKDSSVNASLEEVDALPGGSVESN